MSMTFVINSPTPTAAKSVSYTKTTPSEFALTLSSTQVGYSLCPSSYSSWPSSTSGWVYYTCESQSSTYSTTVQFKNTTNDYLYVYILAMAQGGLAGSAGTSGGQPPNTPTSSGGGGGGGGGQVWCPNDFYYTLNPNDYIQAILYPNGNITLVDVSLHQVKDYLTPQTGSSSSGGAGGVTKIISLIPGSNGSGGGPASSDYSMGYGGNGGNGGGVGAASQTYLCGGGGGGGGSAQEGQPPGPGVQGTNGTGAVGGENGTACTSNELGTGGGGGCPVLYFANGGYQYAAPCYAPISYTEVPNGGSGGNMGYNGTSGYPACFMVYYQQ